VGLTAHTDCTEVVRSSSGRNLKSRSVTEFIPIALGLDPLHVLEYLFGSNIGNKISPDIGNRQGAKPVK
jgi:hypothetical protein